MLILKPLKKATSLISLFKKTSYEDDYDREHDHADECETSDSMSSKESTPANLPEKSHAKRKWSTAIRVVQGLHRFRLPLHRRVAPRPFSGPHRRLSRSLLTKIPSYSTMATTSTRRMSLPQSPSVTVGTRRKSLAAVMSNGSTGGRQLPFGGGPPSQGMRSQHARLSQPDLYSYRGVHKMTTPQNTPGSCTPSSRRILPRAGELPKRFLRRANHSDLTYRLQREREMHTSNESTPSREIDEVPDPVYLALKQATGRYGRRGSSSHLYDSQTPSPRNLSQVSLQDSGYVEMSCAQANPLLGSTPHLENADSIDDYFDINLPLELMENNNYGRSTGRRRAPKLTTQMKSLSLDCQEMPPRIQASGVTRSPLRNKYVQRPNSGKNSQSDLSDWDRSCSPCVTTSRRTSAAPTGPDHSARGGYIVIHEYNSGNGFILNLGDRIRIVDNGDPDWLHGFKANDRSEYLLTFPATCVAPLLAGEQPMRIMQNVAVPELKLRMYRDQIVFAQKDTLVDGKVTVRTEHNAFAACPLTSLTLI